MKTKKLAPGKPVEQKRKTGPVPLTVTASPLRDRVLNRLNKLENFIQFSKLERAAGVPQTYISKWRIGQKILSDGHIEKLGKLFDELELWGRGR